MGEGNQLAGSGESAGRKTISAPTHLWESFDDVWRESDRWDNRSEAIRDLMRSAVEAPHSTNDRVPPTDDQDLADAYETLCSVSRGEWVPEEVVLTELSQEQGEKKEVVRGTIIRPLVDRGYARRTTDWSGKTAAVKALL
jgi:Arc/MetJ-type ribon-helix-helix transcriptional regulator